MLLRILVEQVVRNLPLPIHKAEFESCWWPKEKKWFFTYNQT
jgi:hypothetical protein